MQQKAKNLTEVRLSLYLIGPARFSIDSRLCHCVLGYHIVFKQDGKFFLGAVSSVMEEAIERYERSPVNFYFGEGVLPDLIAAVSIRN